MVGLVLEQAGAQPYGLTQALPVPGIFQITVVQAWLDGGIGGDEPEFTRADRQLQNAGEANPLRRKTST